MDTVERDARLELDALEILCVERALGADVDSVDLSKFISGDPVREAAAQRALSAARAENQLDLPDPNAERAGTLYGPYRLERHLGSGGQGDVWLARDDRLARAAALKILHRGASSAEDALVRFRREAEIAAKLEHPAFCQVYDVGTTSGRAWMALRFVEGRQLGEILKERGPKPPARDEVLRWTSFVRKAAAAAHVAHEANVVHRDFKPSNLMVCRDDEPVILDFGLARRDAHGDSTLTRSADAFGTPKYMAPEQVAGARDVDRRADVYSLAAVLFHAATGAAARKDPTPETLRASAYAPPPSARAANPAVPKGLDVVLSVAMAPDAAHRYFTAQDFADDLGRVLRGEPVLARPPSLARRFASWVRRNTTLSIAVGSVAAVLVGVAAYASAMRAQSEERLDLVSRLGQLRAHRLLVEREPTLWPIEPAVAVRCDDWLAEARRLAASGPSHRAALEALRRLRAAATAGGAPRFADENDAGLEEMLAELCANVDSLTPLIAEVEARAERCRTSAARSIEGAHEEAWRLCAEAVARSPLYGGLKLKPQLGLLPLGPDPRTGLWEFHHIESGAAPKRDAAAGRFEILEETGLVFVLVPGGSYELGTDDDLDWVHPSERPKWTATLDPYFISKYELTQAQWMRLAGGDNPAYYRPGARVGSDDAERLRRDLRHPVESVPKLRALTVLSRFGLTLPTEARWESAARGGARTHWWTGNVPSDLRRTDNVAALESSGDLQSRSSPPDYFDPYRAPAPVGAFQSNGFGLHDVHGNVAEFCLDVFVRPGDPWNTRDKDGLRIPLIESPENETIRGGSMRRHAFGSRLTTRHFLPSGGLSPEAGFRPARDVLR
jgi:formylglycine-generating enzyme required for sulfatase activity